MGFVFEASVAHECMRSSDLFSPATYDCSCLNPKFGHGENHAALSTFCIARSKDLTTIECLQCGPKMGNKVTEHLVQMETP